MGPITGFRVVNLRVREKVAYPDLTVDFATDEHLVIGLENGGGKSTLLGFLIHVFLPQAALFLPRLAQRRQSKKGKEKRIEHYVPGGLPTHMVVELELPHSDLSRRGLPARVLVGACLSKDAGSGADVRAEEFFWSARCVAESLTLAGLGLRAEQGRLRDHREWRAWLDEMRLDHPESELVIHDRQANWDRHLRDALKVDVEFVRSWLLAMNEDEGAADHVFTYASSRAFLNSLVGAVADPASVADLKRSLASMGSDADQMRLDRRREVLLRCLVEQTGPLAELAGELEGLRSERDRQIDALLAAKHRLAEAVTAAEDTLASAQDEEGACDAAARDANAAYNDALARETLARLQLAELRLARTRQELAEQQRALKQAETTEQQANAASLLAQVRTVHARIREVNAMLAAKEHGAEPARQAASSAAQAWRARLDADLAALGQQQAGQAGEEAAAKAAIEAADADLGAAERQIGGREQAQEGATAALEQIDQQLHAAVANGDLLDGQPVGHAHAHALQEAERLGQLADQAVKERDARQTELDQLAKEIAGLEGMIARADGDTAAAKAAYERLNAATSDLTETLAASQLLDLDPIRLDDHAELALTLLRSAIEAAKARQLDAAVQAAAARRAAQALQDTELLPPRADVVALCQHAISEHRLGVRPGWSYLAELPETVAQPFAAAHPALADGIVVNIPEDLEPMLALVQRHRADLDGPVTLGTPEVFELPEEGPGTTVVLPDPAFWSRHAASQQRTRRDEEHQRREHEVSVHADRYDQATQLCIRVAAWQKDIGSGGVDAAHSRWTTAQAKLEELREQSAGLTQRQAALIDQRNDQDGKAREWAAQAAKEQAREQRLERLLEQTARRPKLQADIERYTAELQTARDNKTSAAGQRTEAEVRYTAAITTGKEIAGTIGELRPVRTQAQTLCDVLVSHGDLVAETDAAADRVFLAEQAHTRHERWRGLISDPELRAELTQHQRVLQEELEPKLGSLPEETVAASRDLVDAAPSRAPADFDRDAARARQEGDRIRRGVGRLEQRSDSHEEAVKAVRREYEGLHRAAQLDGEHVTDELQTAERIAAKLRRARDEALESRQRAEGKQADAAKATLEATGRLELITSTASHVANLLVPLSSSGRLTPSVDLEDRAFDLDVDQALRTAPEAVTRLLAVVHDEASLAPAKTQVQAGLEELDADVDQVRRRLDQADQHTDQQLQTVEVTLRDAEEELVAGDRLIHTLRRLPRAQLLANATRHHRDADARLTAVAHHVAKFDQRVDRLAGTTHATVQHLLRAVRQTVKDSHLPTTPALGRWAGLPLLKLGGLDQLTVEQRRAAILTTLHAWFQPDRTDRPAFDADETVWALVEAVTPGFTAKVLVPADPLDPAHKPVDQLAVETSGGEGVTFALLLASLLAARRATAHGHRRTTLLLDNPFAKVTKPAFLRLARDVARSLHVHLVALTGIRDLEALMVFPALIQLRVSRRTTANVVAPVGIDDDRLQPLLQAGTLYVSPTERETATHAPEDGQATWPVMSAAEVRWTDQLQLYPEPDGHNPTDQGQPSADGANPDAG